MVSWLQTPISQKVEDLKLSSAFSISFSNAIPSGKEDTQLTSSHKWMIFFCQTHTT